jgi:predicted metal-dependent hydrolase
MSTIVRSADAAVSADVALSVVSVELPTGELVVAEVKRSERARVTRIQVGVGRLLRVVVPEGASDQYAVEALLTKSDWVKRKLRTVEQALTSADELGLAQQGIAWYAGRRLRISPAPVRFARRRGDELHLPADDPTGGLQRWYRRESRRYLARLLAEEAERLGYRPTRLSVRDQRTRWGSCSANGAISLNWRLLLAPESIARYVVIHELVHLDIPNHSKAFWRALAVARPSWRGEAEWLRKHGRELRQFEPDTIAA